MMCPWCEKEAEVEDGYCSKCGTEIPKEVPEEIKNSNTGIYEYKYVQATLGGFFTEANHYEIIDEHAREGWRLVQVLPMYYNSHGKPTDYEIIFERLIDME